MTAVGFGDDGFVAITNVGGSDGNLDGLFLCQRPNYHQLPDFAVRDWDHGDGCISLLATRGETSLVYNFHLDTVPVIPGTEDDWTYPPFEGRIAEGYVWGRGSLDDKVSGQSERAIGAADVVTGNLRAASVTRRNAKLK